MKRDTVTVIAWQLGILADLLGSWELAVALGLRLGVIYAMLGVVVGEMIAASSGLGYMLSFYAGSLQVSHLMAALVILVALSTALSVAASWIEHRLAGRKRLPKKSFVEAGAPVPGPSAD